MLKFFLAYYIGGFCIIVIYGVLEYIHAVRVWGYNVVVEAENVIRERDGMMDSFNHEHHILYEIEQVLFGVLIWPWKLNDGRTAVNELWKECINITDQRNIESSRT